jgi:hypothetical protein
VVEGVSSLAVSTPSPKFHCQLMASTLALPSNAAALPTSA